MEIIYETEPIDLLIEEFKKGYYKYMGFTITDEYNPPLNPNDFGKYKIIISKSVLKEILIDEVSSEALKITANINYLIIYSLGRNLKEDNTFYGSRKKIIFPINEQRYWKNNINEVKKYFSKNKKGAFSFDLKINLRKNSSINISPLKEIMAMLNECNKLEEIYKYLIYYHCAAHETVDDVRYLLLAKALEIADTILYKHKNKEKRQEFLPIELQEIFNQKGRTLDWLFNIQNNRVETRHVFFSKTFDGINKEMEDVEMFDFMYLTDMLIICIVRKRFNLAFIKLVN